ncbi:MAG: ribonuclease J [Actinobacteria bacterium RBG_16_64_13]|nr:MAG: ribonuclease J [Actinobacteria bacterium RBG_16_64_13]
MTTRSLKVIPLGGLGAIGKNMMVLEYGDAIVVIDTGLMFPDDEMLGIDLVLPDYSYVLENKDRVLGIVVTHGHEDHVGALPYILKEADLPVYGTRLTLALINAKLGEHGLQGKRSLNEISSARSLKLGPFEIEFLEVSHSIPDGVGLGIHTPVGTIIHTGDFKLDQTPIDSRPTEMQRFAELGRKGVLLLLSDSTNADVPGFTIPERSVGQRLESIFALARGRIIVASFASHIHRIQQVMDAASRHGRSLAIVGRSMVKNVNIAQNLGYLTVPEGLVVKPQDIALLPPETVTVLSTGSQGEPLSALARMAAHDHQSVEIMKGDTVIISARPVPGNETSVYRTIDRLFASGARVIYEASAGVHVSGHAAAEELKVMLNLVRPKYFMPIHGEHRHLYFHAELAKSTGIPDENVFLLENGDVLELTSKRAEITGKVQAGMILVDGFAMGDFHDLVLRDRQHLATDGLVMVVVVRSAQDGKILGEPEVVFRGLAHSGELDELTEQARRLVLDSLNTREMRLVTDIGLVKNHVHDVLQKFLRKEAGRRPMVLPVIVEV